MSEVYLPDERLLLRGNRYNDPQAAKKNLETTKIEFRLVRLPHFSAFKFAGVTVRCDRTTGRVVDYGWVYHVPIHKLLKPGSEWSFMDHVQANVLKANFVDKSENIGDRAAEDIFYNRLFPWYKRVEAHAQTILTRNWIIGDTSRYFPPRGYGFPRLPCKSHVQWLNTVWDDEIPMLGDPISPIGLFDIKRKPGKRRSREMEAAVAYLSRNWKSVYTPSSRSKNTANLEGQTLNTMGSENVARVLRAEVPTLRKSKLTADHVRDLIEQMGLRSEAKRGRKTNN